MSILWGKCSACRKRAKLYRIWADGDSPTVCEACLGKIVSKNRQPAPDYCTPIDSVGLPSQAPDTRAPE